MMLFVRLYKTTHRHKRGNKSVQVKFPDGSVLIAGTVVRDAEIKLVGEKQSALLKFGVAIGKRQDTTTIFVNCVCWRSLATSLVGLRKGDSVACIGVLDSREYNGKTYTDLVCEWVNSPNVAVGAAMPLPVTDAFNLSEPVTVNPDDAEDELPF